MTLQAHMHLHVDLHLGLHPPVLALVLLGRNDLVPAVAMGWFGLQVWIQRLIQLEVAVTAATIVIVDGTVAIAVCIGDITVHLQVAGIDNGRCFHGARLLHRRRWSSVPFIHGTLSAPAR
eukprot:CAMPEP_0198115232 /NCGR_PEP_ID=MMETSP1442-20131203/6403_1 /TAXON_ID= /ORGANISM="Craspedostauros australis, Strain CCMP3328" /LENGTH=119 /DNA_ID=CAMNT_0043772707 /DNA_START=280 /DNA_END=639 /DNA_ORIENTATION=-